MHPSQESALEVCQRADSILREIQRGELVPGTDMLAQWETELAQVAALIEVAQGAMTDKLRSGNLPGVRQAVLGNPPASQAVKATVRAWIQLLHGFIAAPSGNRLLGAGLASTDAKRIAKLFRGLGDPGDGRTFQLLE